MKFSTFLPDCGGLVHHLLGSFLLRQLQFAERNGAFKHAPKNRFACERGPLATPLAVIVINLAYITPL